MGASAHYIRGGTDRRACGERVRSRRCPIRPSGQSGTKFRSAPRWPGRVVLGSATPQLPAAQLVRGLQYAEERLLVTVCEWGGDAAAGKPREKRPTRPSGAVGGARPRPGGKRRNAHFSKLRMAERRKAASSHRREEQSYLASEFGFPGLDLFRSFVANEAFE